MLAFRNETGGKREYMGSGEAMDTRVWGTQGMKGSWEAEDERVR